MNIKPLLDEFDEFSRQEKYKGLDIKSRINRFVGKNPGYKPYSIEIYKAKTGGTTN